MILKEQMQVVALLGGLGTRLGKLTSDIPKAMIDIHGKPFFYYQLHLMRNQGFKDFLFCIGYKGELVKEYFGNGESFGVNIRYSSDGDKLLGTGGALRKALPLLDDNFIVIYGDAFLDVDFSELIYNYDRAKETGKKALMAVYENNNNYAPSNVALHDGKLLRYDKKNPTPEMKYIDFGVSIYSKPVIEEIPSGQWADLADLCHRLADEDLIAGYKVRRRFYEVGTPASLEEFIQFIYDRLFIKKPAVFLDRDGTLNEIVFNEDTEQLDSPLNPDEMNLLPNTAKALKTLKSLGYVLVVITNQPAAAKGKTTLGKLYEVNNRLIDVLEEQGVELDDIMICPHHPIGASRSKETFLIRECDCRKPGIGLYMQAVEKFNIDVGVSYVVGDSYADILAAKTAGMKGVFIGTYKCDGCRLLGGYKPDHVFESVYDFAEYLREKERYEKD